MAIDTLVETENSTQSRVRGQFGDMPHVPDRRWRHRGLLALGLIAVFAIAAALVVFAMSSRDIGPKLTYTITRDELLVTVIEQGLLESAENTEIKCKVRGRNTVLWVIDSGKVVEPGDELVRLDTLFIEEQIDERTKYAHWSRSAAERSKASVAAAELAVPEYEEGRYVSDLMKREKDLVIAESHLQSCENLLSHARRMANSEYISQLEVEEKEFTVEQARLNLALKRTEIDVLKRFTQAEELQTLKGNLAATSATHQANAERAIADASRRDRALEEIQHCVVRADRAGLVIHPNAAKWESAPIAEGSTVHTDQVLLLMPDLSKMQVKVGINETVIDRVTQGLSARVTLSDTTLDGTVNSVASVTRPAGWWTGNEVKYDTLITLPPEEGLMPGMSAEVEIIIARYEDVLTIPVAAVVESGKGHFCWVKAAGGAQQRALVLGDSNGIFTVVEKGLQEGDEVVLNPLALGEPTLPAAKSEAETKSPLPTGKGKGGR